MSSKYTNPHPVSFPNSRPRNVIRSIGGHSLPPGTLSHENLFASEKITHPTNLPEHPFLPADSILRLAPGAPQTQALISRARASQHSASKTSSNPFLSLVTDSNEPPNPEESVIPFAGFEPEEWVRDIKRHERIRQMGLEQLRKQHTEQRARQALLQLDGLERREPPRPMIELTQRREDAYQRAQQARKISGEEWARNYQYPKLLRKGDIRKQQAREKEEERKKLEEKRERERIECRKAFDAATAEELRRKGYD
ncbi:hypothetical protein QBC40DRAFT_304263 [Triangularia verruculosa]|uniref:Uncharacterized protein n=1 Tax=Triangularia verruculosa TaxID=2587418 RepID=A0AAN6XMQ0_9PEZI|nr:hypothetical protein QBC40DRAFT_304263 [Triangularia verruculosa]